MAPTPLEIFALSPAPDSGIEIFIKRDDLTGSELSGNKIRKLEFILYDAIAKRSDIILTCGGTQSNHCRATAAMAARIGIDCELILKGKAPAVPDGNFLLDSLFKAKAKFISVQEYEKNINGQLTKRAAALAKKGRRPYIIPEGASDPLGAWGYVLAAMELKSQLDKAGIAADYVACAVGSGGTYAGLYLASKLLDWPVKVIGFAVCRNTDHFVARIGKLVTEFMATYMPDRHVDCSDITIDDCYIGPGYAKASAKEIDFIKGIAGNTGIILDPAYTAKAMIGLFDHISEGKMEKGAKVVFVHTGGLLSIFAYKRELFK